MAAVAAARGSTQWPSWSLLLLQGPLWLVLHALAVWWGCCDCLRLLQSVQDLRAFLPVLHPSRRSLYRDFHEDFLRMLALTADSKQLLPAATQSSALALHLLHLKEVSAESLPGAAAARTEHVDAAECNRRLLPIQLEPMAWQMQPSRVAGEPEGPECLQSQQQQEQAAAAGVPSGFWRHFFRDKGGPPNACNEPPWGVVSGLVSDLMKGASRDIIGRIEQAANELGSFFCSRLPLVHFMEAASGPELTEFTLGLTARLQALRREVNAAVLSAIRPLELSGAAKKRALSHSVYRQQQQRQLQRRQVSALAASRAFRRRPSQEASSFRDSEEERLCSSGVEIADSSKAPCRHEARMLQGPHASVRQLSDSKQSISRGPLESRGAIEVVDVQLQMQHQLIEISAALAEDLAEHGERGSVIPPPEKLLQLVPELQRQLDLERDWTQSVTQLAAGGDDDSALGYYQRQVERRAAISEMLRSRDKETADLALSLMEAAEWVHALKEEGRTPKAVFAITSTEGFPQPTAIENASMLHWYGQSEEWQRWLQRDAPNDAAGDEAVETLEDAQRCAPHIFSKPPLPLVPGGPLPFLTTPAGLAVTDTAAGGSSFAGRSNSNSGCSNHRRSSSERTSVSERPAGLGGRTEKHKLWWEAEAASLAKGSKQLRRGARAVLSHLHLALQAGADWNCLGEGSVEANALWLFVMGKICTNSFFCEGLRSVLFGESLLIYDMLKLAKRAATGSGKPLNLTRVDVVLDGRQEGLARSKRQAIGPQLLVGAWCMQQHFVATHVQGLGCRSV